MAWKQGYRQNLENRLCKCGDERIAHYTAEGYCVVPGCGCQAYKAKGRLEYQNKRATCLYGHAHDSGLEIKHCFDLHLQKQAGEIKDFRFHPVVDLPGPSGRVVARYEVDFRVELRDGTTEWVECKGSHLERDPGWRLKWALLIDKHLGDPKHSFRVVLG